MANAGAVIFNDDDGLSALSIAANKGGGNEGTGGTTTFSFTVTRSGGLDQAVSAKWRAAGVNESGTVPVDGADFPGGVLPGGTVTFAAGQTTAIITVPIVSDTLGELNERFAVTLSNSSAGAAVCKASASVAVLNDDINFEIMPTTVAKAEGDAGNTAFTFTIMRAGVGSTASVDWAVSGSGTSPANAADFIGGTFLSGTVTLASHNNSRTITITIAVAGDSMVEPDETFSVTLSGATAGATITTAAALATILGDESVIDIAPLAARSLEGTGGTSPLTFTVTRSGGLSETQSVAWTTKGITGTGTMPSNAADFAGGVLPSGIVSFAAGESATVLTLDVVADSQREFNERFAVTLSAPSGTATLGTAQARGLILNDDTSVAVITPLVTIVEGGGIWTTMSFYLQRFGALDGVTTVDWAVLPGGVVGTMPISVGDFYDGALSMSGSVTFEAGMNVIDVVLAVGGDALPEFNESFRFVLSNPTGASLGRAEALGVVLDDDRIFGTSASETLTGTAVADLFLIGAGQDVVTGGDGRDRFQFLPSALGTATQNSFTFTDFAPAAGERLDLSRIDAIAGGGNDAFAFIGATPFSSTAGELRWEDQGGFRLVQGDVNGDAIADLTIYLANLAPVQAVWFAL